MLKELKAKGLVVPAIVYTGTKESAKKVSIFLGEDSHLHAIKEGGAPATIFFNTPSGRLQVAQGDYIARYPDGHIRVMAPVIAEESYEVFDVKEAQAPAAKNPALSVTLHPKPNDLITEALFISSEREKVLDDLISSLFSEHGDLAQVIYHASLEVETVNEMAYAMSRVGMQHALDRVQNKNPLFALLSALR